MLVRGLIGWMSIPDFLAIAGPQLRVVSTMSVGYGTHFHPCVPMLSFIPFLQITATYKRLRNAKSSLVIPQTFLPMLVRSPRLVGASRASSLREYSLVADISIMLALMAGRNARETMAIVNEGKVNSLPPAQS